MSFFKALLEEVKANGKFLIGYIITQVPGVTSFPGVITAAKTALSDQTSASFIDLGAQVLLAVAAGHRAVKVVKNAADKS